MDESVMDIDLPECKRQLLTDSIHTCISLLKNCGFMNESPSLGEFSTQAQSLGTEIARQIIETVKDMSFEVEEELFLDNELTENKSIQNSETYSETPSTDDAMTSSQSSYELDTDDFNIIPLDYKIKVINMVREHPYWKLSTIQNNGGSRLSRLDEIARWKKDVERGGTDLDKYQHIDNWTYQRFIENRMKKKPVYSRDLRVWAMQAATQYQSEKFHFTASESWVIRFKNKHRIRMRNVTRYVKPSERNSVEDIVDTASNFQVNCSATISKYDLDFVINTDQIGCEYRVNSQRTLTDRGAKVVEAYIGDLNKVSHSYTAQYSITASGNLLPKVFICLQETKGVFGPVVQKDVDRLVAEFQNVCVTCSKSGKLTSDLVGLYIDNILRPYVTKDFLLIQDSWGGQSQKLFSLKLDNLNVNYEIEVIPAGCTRFAQPLDVYFHRQVKKLIKRIQESTELLVNDRQISTRSDAIKIHSLIHNQLSAPIFQEMIQYAWFASKLIPNRKVFFNVNQVCFPKEIVKNNCCNTGCDQKVSFIRCSWCRKYLCFVCFYDFYHANTCTK